MDSSQSTSEQMTDPLESLKAVLCDPEGRVCIAGSGGDRRVIQDALAALASERAKQEEPVVMFKSDDPSYNKGFAAGYRYAAPPAAHPAPGYCPHCKQYTIAEPLPADDEAVRLLREALDWIPLETPMFEAIDAYLARVTK